MKISTEDIIEEFEAFGIKIKTEVLLNKCATLCSQHGLAADQLAANWLGFAATHSYDELTLDHLDAFEREQLNKKKKVGSSRASVALPVYTSVDTIDDDDILVAYGASPAAKKLNPQSRRKTPDHSGKTTTTSSTAVGDKTGVGPRTPRPLLPAHTQSPHTRHLSPSVTKPSQRYSDRTNSGAVVSSYASRGREAGDLQTKEWLADEALVPQISCSGGLDEGSSSIMFEKLRETGCLQEDAVLHMADQVAPFFGGDDCWNDMDVASNESVNCVGRVCCDSVGKLNAASVLLEGSRELAGSAVLQLDLSRLQHYALFPGQVIGVSGVNSTGQRLVVEELVGGRVPSFPDYPITITHSTGPVQILVACGPFTTTDNLLYEPLSDLLATVAREPPHLLLLLGPLLDASHPLLLEGSITETFQGVVTRVLAMVHAAMAKCSTEVFIVSSHRDATSSSVYPTAPLQGPSTPRLHLLPDPSMLVVEGVAVALTTVDVIMDLGKEELIFPEQQGDHLHRRVHHVLAQQVLYPVSPAPDSLCLSPALLQKHAGLNCRPHVMLLPSDIRNFVKDVCGCVTVNPHRLCKGMSGGSYARLELYSPTEEEPDRPAVVAAVYRI